MTGLGLRQFQESLGHAMSIPSVLSELLRAIANESFYFFVGEAETGYLVLPRNGESAFRLWTDFGLLLFLAWPILPVLRPPFVLSVILSQGESY